MSLEKELQNRSGNQCELSGVTNDLVIYQVPPLAKGTLNDSIYITQKLAQQLDDEDSTNPNDWRCLNDSMWSEVPAVQVVAWRMLTRMRAEGWTQDLLDMMYLEDETLKWARATGEGEEKIVHKDSNGVVLQNGDNVVLIQDLNVKGGGFTAKRGTAVRRISLVHDNAEHIEGKVEGQSIVILTKFVKKS